MSMRAGGAAFLLLGCSALAVSGQEAGMASEDLRAAVSSDPNRYVEVLQEMLGGAGLLSRSRRCAIDRGNHNGNQRLLS